MKVQLETDSPITDDACKAATGRTLAEWLAVLNEDPTLRDKRREALNWLYPAMNKDVWWPTTAWVEHERALGRTQKDGRPEGYNICVTKTIGAPVEIVYAAWSGVGFGSWYGDDPKTEPDGSFRDQSGNIATSTRVRENKDLRYRWRTGGIEAETDFDVVFSDKGGGKTGLLINHNRIQTREEADGLRRAWAEAFDCLKQMVETKK